MTVPSFLVSRVYPPENSELFEQIIAEDRGALVSELPMAVGVQSRNFPLRNRIISGLTLGTLVVEAGRKSGAMITAREAIEQGREVFAVPGRIDSVMSQGTNDIIGAGSAKLVQDLDDILDGLGEVGRTLTTPEPTDDERLAAAVLNPAERSLVAALKEREKSLDELVRETRLDASAVISTLTMLAIRGIVAQRPGSVFALKRNGWGRVRTCTKTWHGRGRPWISPSVAGPRRPCDLPSLKLRRADSRASPWDP